MKIYGKPLNGSTEALLFDIDDTVYRRNREYRETGDRYQLDEVAAILRSDVDSVNLRIENAREMLSRQRGGAKVTLTDTVFSLGITPRQWSELRCRAWQPEQFLKFDPELCSLLTRLQNRYIIAFGTNSPHRVGERILGIIGIRSVLPRACLFGPEDVEIQKPGQQFFEEIAHKLGLLPGNCVSIGDRDFSDIHPALEAGYVGAVHVENGRDEVIEFGAMLLKQ